MSNRSEIEKKWPPSPISQATIDHSAWCAKLTAHMEVLEVDAGKDVKQRAVSNMVEFLQSLFSWDDTLEGRDYWQKVAEVLGDVES